MQGYKPGIGIKDMFLFVVGGGGGTEGDKKFSPCTLFISVFLSKPLPYSIYQI